MPPPTATAARPRRAVGAAVLLTALLGLLLAGAVGWALARPQPLPALGWAWLAVPPFAAASALRDVRRARAAADPGAARDAARRAVVTALAGVVLMISVLVELPGLH